MFPNIVDELRDVRVEDLVPRGYGTDPDIVGVFESGGTTGAPKRVIVLRDWWHRMVEAMSASMDAHGMPRNVNWLSLAPTGPHLLGRALSHYAVSRGGLNFSIDMDPRWVRKLILAGRTAEAEAYTEHLIEQAGFVLRTQDVGVLMTTPPMLERLAVRDDLRTLINDKVGGIHWGGAHMDTAMRHWYQTEVFPDVTLHGSYGSTMALGVVGHERPAAEHAGRCVFDAHSPYVTFAVVDPATGRQVGYGERGQVVMNHVSKNMLLPNNLERDLGTRVEPPPGGVGDSVADVSPVQQFGNEVVVEGVY
jgi:phenylacetate-coenzyme A ligase PaaK-like adenylate-forming protein